MNLKKPGMLRRAVEERKKVLIHQLDEMGVLDSKRYRFHEMTLTELEEIYRKVNDS